MPPTTARLVHQPWISPPARSPRPQDLHTDNRCSVCATLLPNTSANDQTITLALPGPNASSSSPASTFRPPRTSALLQQAPPGLGQTSLLALSPRVSQCSGGHRDCSPGPEPHSYPSKALGRWYTLHFRPIPSHRRKRATARPGERCWDR